MAMQASATPTLTRSRSRRTMALSWSRPPDPAAVDVEWGTPAAKRDRLKQNRAACHEAAEAWSRAREAALDMLPHAVAHRSFADATRRDFERTVAVPPWVEWVHPTHRVRFVGVT